MATSMYLPTPVRFDVLDTPLHRLETINGQTFAVLNNGWACMNELTLLLEHELTSRGATEVHHFRTPHAQPSPDDYLDEIASKVAGAITGLGN
jgi:hypothetical protein